MSNLPDFKVAYNGGVAAVYVVNPKILELDDPRQRGKPFLFFLQPTTERARDINADPLRQSAAFPYVGKRADLEDLTRGRSTEGNLPSNVEIAGESVDSKTLSSTYVPFSHDTGHRHDVERATQGNDPCRVDLGKFRKFWQNMTDKLLSKEQHK